MARKRKAPTHELKFSSDMAEGLRLARENAGLTLREAAEQADLNITSLWRFEHDRMQPTYMTLVKLCVLYGMNLNIGPDGLMLTWMEKVA